MVSSSALTLAAIWLPVLAADGEAYAWPLDLPRVLTSSFAEYRPDRFHMGIDLRTGPIGKPVRAAADGHVSRIRVSPFGYGKAVYVQLSDGRTAVYAHLDGFAPALEAYVWAEQHRRRSYTVNLYPAASMFPVRRGEVIARSGQTGIGVPHLHYELRDEGGVPVNPRLLGISWPDRSAPVFRRAAVLPMDPDTILDGDLLPVILDVTRTGSARYRTAPVNVSGPVAFAVDVIDPAAGGSIRLGVRTLQVAAAGREVFLIKHERISYGRDRAGAVSYHPYLSDHGRFLNLFRWPGNNAEIYAHSADDGVFHPPAGPVEIQIGVEDFMGNTAMLTIPIRPGSADPPPAPDAESIGSGTVSMDVFGQWLDVSVVFESPETESPSVLIGAAPTRALAVRRINDTTFRCRFVPRESDRLVTLRVGHPRLHGGPEKEIPVLVAANGNVYSGSFGGVRVYLDENAAYGTFFINVIERDTPAAPDGLVPIGPAYDVWHPSTPLAEPVELLLPVPPGLSGDRAVAVYRLDDDEWEWNETRTREAHAQISTRKFGTFAVMADTTPPALMIAAPSDGETADSNRPAIRARIVEKGSGIKSYDGFLNGEWILMAYDPERDVLEWEQDEDLPAGSAELLLTVTDEAGNRTETRRRFTIGPSSN